MMNDKHAGGRPKRGSDTVGPGDMFNAYLVKHDGGRPGHKGYGSISFEGKECAGRIARGCPFRVKKLHPGLIITTAGDHFERSRWLIEKIKIESHAKIPETPPATIWDRAIELGRERGFLTTTLLVSNLNLDYEVALNCIHKLREHGLIGVVGSHDDRTQRRAFFYQRVNDFEESKVPV